MLTFDWLSWCSGTNVDLGFIGIWIIIVLFLSPTIQVILVNLLTSLGLVSSFVQWI